MKKWAKRGLVLIVAALMFSAIKNQYSTNQAPGSDADESAASVVDTVEPVEPEVGDATFAEIYTEYKANEIRADELYKGNRYRLSGTVYDIDADPLLSFGSSITVKTTVAGNTVFFVANFPSDQKDSLLSLNVGDPITLTGACRSWSTWSDCKLED